MFIELTDILRCPEPHEEQFLVLVPGRMDQRSVLEGTLGCPVCQNEYPIRSGIAEFSKPAPVPPADPPDPEALTAFLGLTGPGGYAGLVGAGTDAARALLALQPQVHLLGINPPPGSTELPMLSLAHAGSLPVKSRSLRGVVLLGEFGTDAGWVEEAGRAVLPGLRVVGQGAAPALPGLEVLGAAAGWWVARRS